MIFNLTNIFLKFFDTDFIGIFYFYPPIDFSLYRKPLYSLFYLMLRLICTYIYLYAFNFRCDR